MNGREEADKKYIEKSKRLAQRMPEFVLGYIKDNAVNMQPRTIYSYTEIVCRFLKRYAETHNIDVKKVQFDAIEEQDIKDFLEQINYKINKEGDTVRTSASYYRTNWFALLSLSKYLEKEGLVKRNVITKAQNRKPGRRVKKYNYLSENEVQKLMSILREPYYKYINKEAPLDPLKIRDMVIIEIYLQTGMRLSALTQMKLNDINENNNTLYVIDKGDKVFEHHIPEQLMDHLSFYIATAREKLVVENEFDTDYVFFSSGTGAPLSRIRIYEIVTHYTELAGNKVSPHKLRSTYALTLYDKTKDAILVQHKMGHATLKTTMAYINHVSDEKKEMADRIMADMLF